MRGFRLFAGIAVCMSIVSGAYALERDADIVQSAGIEAQSYDAMDIVRVAVWGEKALHLEDAWAVVVGLSYGLVSYEGGDAPRSMSAALGIKRGLGPRNELLALISGEWVDSGSEFATVGASLTYRHRLRPDEASVLPFLEFGGGFQTVKAGVWGGQIDSFAALVIKAAVGCDFTLTEDCSLVMQVSYVDSSDFSSSPYGSYADGFVGVVALKYYWQ